MRCLVVLVVVACFFLAKLVNAVDAVATTTTKASSSGVVVASDESLFQRASELNEQGNQLRASGDAKGASEAYVQASLLLPESVDIRKNLLSVWLTTEGDSLRAIEYARDQNLLYLERMTVGGPTVPTVRVFDSSFF